MNSQKRYQTKALWYSVFIWRCSILMQSAIYRDHQKFGHGCQYFFEAKLKWTKQIDARCKTWVNEGISNRNWVVGLAINTSKETLNMLSLHSIAKISHMLFTPKSLRIHWDAAMHLSLDWAWGSRKQAAGALSHGCASNCTAGRIRKRLVLQRYHRMNVLPRHHQTFTCTTPIVRWGPCTGKGDSAPNGWENMLYKHTPSPFAELAQANSFRFQRTLQDVVLSLALKSVTCWKYCDLPFSKLINGK